MSDIENNKYNIDDLLGFSLEKKPVEFKDAFDSILGDKILDKIEARKEQLAKTMFNPPVEEPELEDEGNEEV